MKSTNTSKNNTHFSDFHTVDLRLQDIAELALGAKEAIESLKPTLLTSSSRIAALQQYIDSETSVQDRLKSLADAFYTIISTKEVLSDAFSRPVPEELLPIFLKLNLLIPSPPDFPSVDASCAKYAALVQSIANKHKARLSQILLVLQTTKTAHADLQLFSLWLENLHSILVTTHDLVSLIHLLGSSFDKDSPSPKLKKPAVSANNFTSLADAFHRQLSACKNLFAKVRNSSLAVCHAEKECIFPKADSLLKQLAKLAAYLTPRKLRLFAHAIAAS